MNTPQQHTAPPQQPPVPPASPAFPPQPQPQTQGYWPGQTPVGGYVSPIPLRRATLTDALAAEWTKIRSLRSTMWTLGTMVVLTVGIGLLIAVALGSTNGSTGENTGSVLVLGLYGVMLGVMCVITLGVLTISSEYGTGLIRTTLTACPDRARVLTAKAVVFFLLTFTITLLSTGIVAVADDVFAGHLASVDPSGEQWVRATIGMSLFVSLLGVVSLAVGTVVRHAAGAITTMLGIVLLPLIMALFMDTSSLQDVRDALFGYSIPSQMAALYDVNTLGGPTGWTPLWIMLGATAVALGGAYTSLLKRDA
ncbi:ABC transporter permease [Streptomyces cinnamoneus]|uniref:ABC transporter permease n=1 Tax=Streptomyces cinnamoneus TaxID=53446 RepID=A0A2G1XDB9_STRCJ|nr:ABC transporter permease subunit [Streptomyces cinnamoneus]PHQ49191.1 ABC transporter permease [Streptomyces cinnamoneus]PPT15159.1 ABC transporter permease [Streptomyces cinnamoneus]